MILEQGAAAPTQDAPLPASRGAPVPILRAHPEWSFGSSGTGNALIQGDNLAVMEALRARGVPDVRCAYLDPPYNNGDTYRHYQDKRGHEDWLASIAARMSVVRDLLTPDGSMWVSIDDAELHYLKVAADGIFGRANFAGTLIWERRVSRENRRVFSRSHEYLLVYAKDLRTWTKARNTLPCTAEVSARYKNPDSDPRGPWQSVSANVQGGHATASQTYAITAPNGQVHVPPKGRAWVYTEERMREERAANNLWFGGAGTGVPRLKCFLADRSGGLIPETLWRGAEVGTTADAKKELLSLFKNDPLFDTPKPEALMERILHISTNPGDRLLDAYLGSGTGTAVAHKMGRAYTGIEEGDHITSHCAPRMQKVVQGEPGGVSRKVGWTGGGGYDFYTL